MTPTYQSGFYAPGRGRMKYPELWDSCVGAWNPGLGQSGLVLRDWSGSQNHGTLTNGPTWGVYGGRQALNFDGVDDYVPTRVIAATNAVTFTAWFRLNVVVTFRTICSDANPAGTIINFHMETGGSNRLGVLWGSGPYFRPEGATVLLAQSWYHGAVTRSGASGAWDYKIYLNGKKDGSGSTNINPGAASTFTIGRPGEASVQYINANLADTRIYNRALSANEITLLATRPGIAYELAPRKVYSIPPSPSSQFYDVLSPSIFAGSI